MKIGIDIDETLTDTEKSFDNVIKKYNIKTNKKYKDNWSKTDFLLIDRYTKEMLESAKLKVGVREAIDKLNLLGHEIYIITARSDEYCQGIEKFTINFLNTQKIYYKKIYFGQDLKSDLAKKLDIKLMIDDNKKVYNNMLKENIDCILFGDKINTWEEVLMYIENKVKEDG